MRELQNSIVFFYGDRGEIFWGLASEPSYANDISYYYTVAYVDTDGKIKTAILHEYDLHTSLLMMVYKSWINALRRFTSQHKYTILNKLSNVLNPPSNE